ncbi:MAG: hypothetical protein GPJ54_10030 [Candidatus Heimdallarchaeota archaeon]|nr:hypothetical protein [Candidatus Heimdallarchaeota archaeon]
MKSIITGGYIAAGSILALAIFGIFTKKIESAMIVSLFLLFEGLTYISSFFLDIAFRDTFSRYLLLLVALVLSTVGTFVLRSQEESMYQQIHRVIASYMGWITILYMGGSSYIDPLYYTLVIIAMVIISHVSGLKYPSMPVIGSSLIIETIILFDVEVINTSYLFPVAVIHVIILPIIFYLQDREIIRFRKESGIRTALSIYFLPLIPIYLAMSRGAIVAPFSHILVGLFAASWVLYFSISIKDTDNFYQTLITSVMVIIMFLYSIFNTGVNMVVMEIIILLVMVRLLPEIKEKYAQIARIVLFSISIITSARLYVEGTMIWYCVLHMIMILLLLYLPSIRKNGIADREVNIQILLIGINLSIFYILKKTDISFMILVYLIVIVLYLLTRFTSIKIPYLIISVFYTLVGSSSITYNLESIDQAFIFGLIGFSIIFIIGIIGRAKFDNLPSGWILSSLPLILMSSNIVNHWLLNGFILILFICSLFSILINKKEYWYLIFLFEAIWMRMVNYGEVVSLFGVSVWSLSVMITYIILGVVILFTIFSIRNESWIPTVFLLSIWLLTSVVYQNFENQFQDLILENTTWMVSQIGLIGFMILSYFNFYKSSTIVIIDKVKQFSILGILNYLLLLLVANPLADIFGNIITLMLLLIGNRVREEMTISKPVLMVYLISLTTNLIGFSLSSRIGTNIFFILIILVLSYSKILIPLFTSMSNTIKNLMIYCFTTILMLVFIGIGSLLIIDGLVIFQIISLMIMFQIRNMDDERKIMQSIVFLLGNLILLSSVFDLDFEIYTLFNSEMAVQAYRFIITAMIWISFIYIAWQINERRDSKELMPELDFITVAVAVNIILLIIVSSLQFTHLQFIKSNEMNQILATITVSSLIILAIYERKVMVSKVSKAGMIASFIVLLQSTLLAFFSSPMAVLILSIVAVFLSIVAFYTNDRKLIIVSIAIFMLVIIKFFLDLMFFIDPLDKALSGIFTGIDFLWFAASFNRISGLLKPHEDILDSDDATMKI